MFQLISYQQIIKQCHYIRIWHRNAPGSYVKVSFKLIEPPHRLTQQDSGLAGDGTSGMVIIPIW